MIRTLAFLLSVGWLVFVFGHESLPNSPNDPDGYNKMFLAIGMNVAFLALGIVAVVLAARRRYSWRMASLIAATPFVHAVGIALPPLFIVPSILILGFVAWDFAKRFLPLRRDA